MSLKHFIQITKPGIIFGNVLSVAGGFFLASKGHVDLAIFLAAMIGCFRCMRILEKMAKLQASTRGRKSARILHTQVSEVLCEVSSP